MDVDVDIVHNQEEEEENIPAPPHMKFNEEMSDEVMMIQMIFIQYGYIDDQTTSCSLQFILIAVL
jgi:hypothetical protein